jgi:O-antigen/teichoic acid export membrane protein
MSQVEQAASATDQAIAQSLRSHVFHGLKWSVVIVVANQLSRLATSFVLVRLLTPSDYGLAGMALVFSGLVMALSDLGLGAGLVQRSSLTELDCATVFWTSVCIGTALVVTGIATSGLVADFFREPAVQPLFIAMSFGFMFPALQQTPAALLQRAMNFRAIAIRSIGASIAASVVGITGAALGWGAWALIASALTAGIVTTILLWMTAGWRPRLMYSRESLRHLSGFGLPLLGARTLDYVQGNADNILVGRYLGAEQLGLYTVAYNVILLPATRVFGPISDALFPALSRIKDDIDRLASVWLRTVRVVGAFITPTMLGTIVIIPDFVLVVFGQKWLGSVPVVQLLAIVTLMDGLGASGSRVLLAMGRSTLIFRVSALRSGLAVLAFIVGLRWGIVGVAACYTVASVPVQAYLMVVATRALGIRRSLFVRNIAGVVEASLAMFALCWVTRSGLVAAGVGPAARLAIVITLGAVAYLAALAKTDPWVIREVKGMLPRPPWPGAFRRSLARSESA